MAKSRLSPLGGLAGTIRSLSLVVAGLLIAEFLLQAAAAVSLPVRKLLAPSSQRDQVFLPDPALEYRGNPLRTDHDEEGYRNSSTLRRADIVTLGDSHTYGVSVGRDMAWPRLVGARTGLSVYNMGLPGYSPAHGLVQLDRALELRPRLVIVAVYFGNDFYDAFALSRINPQVAYLMPPDLAEASDAAEREGMLKDEVNGLFQLLPANRPAAGTSGNQPVLPRRLLSEHSRLYGLLRALVSHFARPGDGMPDLFGGDFARAVESLTPEDLRVCSVFDNGAWRTILTAPYRFRVLDDRDPRIRAGFGITLGALDEIGARSRAAGAALLVVLLPTKENVFASNVRDPTAHIGFADLARAEDSYRRQLKTHLATRGIPVVDVLEPLRESAAQPYFEDADGHPNDLGHRIIADHVGHIVDRLMAQDSHAAVSR